MYGTCAVASADDRRSRIDSTPDADAIEFPHQLIPTVGSRVLRVLLANPPESDSPERVTHLARGPQPALGAHSPMDFSLHPGGLW